MEYVLIPGDVYVRPANRNRHAQHTCKSPSSRPKRLVNALATVFRHLSGRPKRLVMDTSVKRQSALQQPGFQLLATCKQAYNDGRYMFYSMNTFHWPPGPVNCTDGWYANLQPEHRKMIRTICIDLDFVDLMYGGTHAIEASARRHHGGQPGDYDGNAWSIEAMFQLELRMWAQILSLYCRAIPYNLRGFNGLERVIVQSSIGRCVMNSPLGTNANEWESLKELVTAVSTHFEIIVQYHVNGRGWRKTKKWLDGLSRTRFRA